MLAQLGWVLAVGRHGVRRIAARPVGDRLQPDFRGVPVVGHGAERIASVGPVRVGEFQRRVQRGAPLNCAW